MKNYIFAMLGISFFLHAHSQNKPAYRIFSATGKKVKYAKMVKALREKDIVLFGELHNNPIAHWLELSIARDIKTKQNLTLGAEMVERDNQELLSDYLNGKIKEEEWMAKARLWNNYPTDYAPLINFAKSKNIEFIATNIPRRYASMVAKGGFGALDTLPAMEKQWIAPLPIAYDANLPGYKKMLEMMPGHSGENFPKAQAIKDATMAYFILKNFHKGYTFLHYNGAYHSDNYEGILWYLQKQQPGLRYATITTVSQESLKKLEKENKKRADYIICVDADMTTTY